VLNDRSGDGRRYQDQVPAVARAVRVLETLASSADARSLADLARELAVSPSSLLAILTTLRNAGLVARTPAGHYDIGVGLAALGSAAARRQRACDRFAAIADRLVAAVGETVLLWILQDEAFVLVAAREGIQPLRYVPTPGLVIRATGTRLGNLEDQTTASGPAAGRLGGTVEEELLPGVWTIAALLPGCPNETACVALAGPRERLAVAGVRELLLATCQAVPDEASIAAADEGRTDAQTTTARDNALSPTESSAAAASLFGPIDGAELDGFLSQSLVATLSYLADDGYPATVPLWYAWDGTAFWLASRPGSEWAEHIRVDPRISLAVSESSPPLRRVMARGCLTEIDDPGSVRWAEIEAQLASRYAGFDAAREPPAAGRGRLFRLEPERLIAWRGLLRYPKPPPGPESPGTSAWRHLG
jgi:DNA-binding IclR family transcriptional regulator